jgi:hypothetical protein
MENLPDANFDTGADCNLQLRHMKDQWRAELGQRQNQTGQLEQFSPFFELGLSENGPKRAIRDDSACRRSGLMRQRHDKSSIRMNFELPNTQVYHKSLENLVSFMR